VRYKSTDISKKRISSIFRAEQESKQEVGGRSLLLITKRQTYIIFHSSQNINVSSEINVCAYLMPVTVAELSKACTVFARSEAGIVGSNPTQSMDIWYMYVFILCLCFPVFR
jgi:hypothetical protein